MTIRILVADDHKLIRLGVQALITGEPDFEVVGETADSDETLRLAESVHPDIVLMDISMPGVGGIETTRALCKRLPGVRVLILTVHEDEAMLREALRAGAMGYIVKRAADSELIHALRAVARGDHYIHPTMTRALLRELTQQPSPDPRAVESLTSREIEVLRLLVNGYTNRQVAEELSISIRTAEGHRASLMSKLGLRSRLDLVNFAAKHGLI